MAHKIEGKLDSKPLSAEQQTKVQNALVSSLEHELTIRGTHHVDITHVDITYEHQQVKS